MLSGMYYPPKRSFFVWSLILLEQSVTFWAFAGRPRRKVKTTANGERCLPAERGSETSNIFIFYFCGGVQRYMHLGLG